MIIFLDFDGVLHPTVRGEPVFCRLPLLWKILRACPEVKVVFSTTWRDDYSPKIMLDYVTSGGGEDLAHRFIGSTPNLESEGCYARRDLEILRWLDTNGNAEQWIALDDMAEIFGGGHPNLYVVNGLRGLTETDVAMIVKRILGAKENNCILGISEKLVIDTNVEELIDTDMTGTFIETAFSPEHIVRAIRAESELGIRNSPCAFLNDEVDKKHE